MQSKQIQLLTQIENLSEQVKLEISQKVSFEKELNQLKKKYILDHELTEIQKYQQNEISLRFMNQKLLQQIEQLDQQLGQMDQKEQIKILLKNIKELQQLYQDDVSKYELLLKSKDTKLDEAKIRFDNFRVMLNKQDNTIERLKQENSLLDQKLLYEQNLNQDSKIKVVQYYEIALMQYEDLQQQLIQNQILQQQIGDQENKLSELQIKLNNFLQSDDNTTKDSFIINKIKTRLSEEPELRQATKLGSIDESQSFEEKIKYCQINRPAFPIFIDQNILEQITPSKSVTSLFIATIRAILDSKFNEFRLMENCFNLKGVSKFPDFVYSWLGRYYICPNTRSIKLLEESQGARTCSVDEIRAQFLVDLDNPKLEKLWECVTFKEFLMDQRPLEELYFYLHTRHMLFSGPQLEIYDAKFNLIHFINFELAKNEISTTLYKFPKHTQTFVINQIQEKVKTKGEIGLIDSGFVLRILLEYYILDRIEKYKIIQTIFGKQNFTFKQFREFFVMNYPTGCDLDIAELYRDCWNLGHGAVTTNVFFTVATEKNFFLQSIKLRRCNAVPIELTSAFAICQNQPLGNKISNFYLQVIQNQKVLQLLESELTAIGNERLQKEFQKVYRIQKDKFQGFPENFPFYSISEYYNWMLEFMLVIINTRAQRQLAINFQESDLIVFYQNQFQDLLSILISLDKKEKINQLTIKNKLKVFQRFCKKKISSWNAVLTQFFSNVEVQKSAQQQPINEQTKSIRFKKKMK